MPDLGNVRGGRKALWLRQHRSEVLDYFAAHGVGDTMEHFHLHRFDTLEKLLEAGFTVPGGTELAPPEPIPQPPKDCDRLERLEIQIRDLQTAIKTLNLKYDRLDTRVQITDQCSRELRGEVRQLVEASQTFIERAARKIVETMILPIVQALNSQMPCPSIPDISISCLVKEKSDKNAIRPKGYLKAATEAHPLNGAASQGNDC